MIRFFFSHWMMFHRNSTQQHHVFECAIGNDATSWHVLRSVKLLPTTPVCTPLWVDHKTLRPTGLTNTCDGPVTPAATISAIQRMAAHSAFIFHFFIPSFNHSFIQSFNHSLTHLLARSLCRSLVHSCVKSFIQAFEASCWQLLKFADGYTSKPVKEAR